MEDRGEDRIRGSRERRAAELLLLGSTRGPWKEAARRSAECGACANSRRVALVCCVLCHTMCLCSVLVSRLCLSSRLLLPLCYIQRHPRTLWELCTYVKHIPFSLSV
jgi:hypothetical protein